MATMTLGERFRLKHECNGYCRAGRHAEVLWANPALVAPGTEVDSLREVLRALDLVFVHAEPAPEAARPRGLVGGIGPCYVEASPTIVGPGDVPWLVVFALAGTGADDAAPAGEL